MGRSAYWRAKRQHSLLRSCPEGYGIIRSGIPGKSGSVRTFAAQARHLAADTRPSPSSTLTMSLAAASGVLSHRKPLVFTGHARAPARYLAITNPSRAAWSGPCGKDMVIAPSARCDAGHAFCTRRISATYYSCEWVGCSILSGKSRGASNGCGWVVGIIVALGPRAHGAEGPTYTNPPIR